MGIFGELPRYGFFAITAGVYLGGRISVFFFDLARAADLKATSRRLRPRFLPTSPTIGAGWRRRALLGCPIPSSNLLALSAKFAPRWAGRTNPQRSALGAGGAVPIAPACYSEILFLHPVGRAEVPRANLAPGEYIALSA